MSRVALIGAQLEENLALLSLESMLRGAGHEAFRISFNQSEDCRRVVDEVCLARPDLVGLSMVFTRRAHEFAALADALREGSYAGHLTCGGHFASFNAGRLLTAVPAVDSVVLGEGEEVLAELAGKLGDPSTVPGLQLRSGPTAARSPCLDLDRRPWPTRDHRRASYLGFPIANLLSGRGCFGTCAYCSVQTWYRTLGTGFRLRQVESVAAEMATLFHGHGVKIFNFHDDNFLLPELGEARARVLALRRALDREGVGRIAVAVKARPDSIEPAIVEALVELGLFRVFLGVESGSDRSLAQLGRGTTVEANHRALDVLGEAGIHVTYNLMLFGPRTSVADLADNLDFFRRHLGVPMNFCRTEVYAGTPLEAWLERRGRLLGDWWARDYVIEEPRVEAAFCAVHRAFNQRCFAVDGLHHLAMQVDYLRKIASQLAADRLAAATAARARGAVHQVVADTLTHLDEVVAWATGGRRPPDDAEVVRFADELERSIERSRARIEPELDAIISLLEQGAVPTAGTGSGIKRAAAAAAVAVLLEGTAACGRPQPAPPPAATAPPVVVPLLDHEQISKVLVEGPIVEWVRAFFGSGDGATAWKSEVKCWSEAHPPKVQRDFIAVRSYEHLRIAMAVSDSGRIVGLRLLDPVELPDDLLLRLRSLAADVRFPAGGEAGTVVIEMCAVDQRLHMCEWAHLLTRAQDDSA